MTELFYVLALALAPVGFLFTGVYLFDRHDREPLKVLILSFVLGILIAVPAVFMEIYLGDTLQVGAGQGLWSTLTFAMVVVAGTEEGLKFLALRLYPYRSKYFDEPYDGIMYAVAVSLGFAAIENVLYVANYGYATGLLRMFTAVPGHAMMAVLMGYFVGMAKFSGPHWGNRTVLLIIGLAAGILTHGLYDFFLMYDEQALAGYAFVVLIVAFVLSIRAMRIHQRQSPHRGPA